MHALHYCLCLLLFTTYFILHYLAADQVLHYEPLTLAIRKDALRLEEVKRCSSKRGVPALFRKIDINRSAVDISICLHLIESQICIF